VSGCSVIYTGKYVQKLKEALKESKSCLFLTSAGMSAESGIPTFRDREGYWRNFPAYKDLGLDAIDLANPASFRLRPAHAWAFYEWRRRNARENTPHEGYGIINRLIDDHFEHSFVHTTNTDGYHLISGLPHEYVYEIHGSIWRLQCMGGIGCSYAYADEDRVPLCELDYGRMAATGLPMCPHCGSLLRPNVLMFGDFEYVEHAYQYGYFRNFLDTAGVPDMVMLIGSSGAVPTNDHLASRLRQAGSFVVTINPDESAQRVCGADIFLQTGAKDALSAIAEAAGL
jgi:NAD-dependent SIR2 family protein deacetylase